MPRKNYGIFTPGIDVHKDDSVPFPELWNWVFDLSDLDDVRRACEDETMIERMGGKIDVLIENASIHPSGRGKLEEGQL